MFKTYSQILAELIADLQANTNITDVQSGSLTYTLLAVVARALRIVWFMVEQMVNLFFVSSSQGSFLERRCNERGVIRKLGTNASGTVNLTRSSAALIGTTLTQGTLLATLDGLIEFTVNANVTLPVGWTNIPAVVTCITLGANGNLAASTPLQVVGAQVVGVQNIVVASGGLSGGTETETDDLLKARYLFTIQNPQNGGTAADYIVWATSVNGVLHAISLPLNRGAGTVDVVITDGSIPPDSLVTTVTDYIATQRPVGADVLIKKPTAHVIDVTGVISAATGYTNAALIPLVTTAIQKYLGSVPIGGVVRFSGIIQAALAVPGVLDFVMTVPNANVALSAIELATSGAMTIS